MSASGSAAARCNPHDIDVIATNLKHRLSGVTSTLERLLPVQSRTLSIAALGTGLSPSLPHIHWMDIPKLSRKPRNKPFRIWHARRNIEMLAGIILRDVMRFPVRIVFTSASQRHHTAWSRYLISRMDAVISTSAVTASYLRRPSTVIEHGIDSELFYPSVSRAAQRSSLGLPDLHLVGCFGRIRHQKGTDVFIDAMLRILPARPNVGAVLLGRAAPQHARFHNELSARVKAAGLSDRIFFAGEVAPSRIPEWYRALDVFIAPQRWEGFGVTPLEAMASGLPVIATQVGAFPQLLTSETGFLIEPGNADEMARSSAMLLDDPALAARMGDAGLKRVRQEFSMEREALKISAVYEDLWNSSNSAR